MKNEELLARECIRHTMAKYSVAGDAFNAHEYIECFTADAVLEFSNFPGRGELHLEGREAILEFVAGFFAAVRSGEAAVPGKFMRHHLTTSLVEFVDAGTANAKTYCIEFNVNGAEHCGFYSDVLRRDGDDWLLAYRRWNSDT